MNSKDLFDLELMESRPPDLRFSSELDGKSYDVEAWSIGGNTVVELPKYGKFDVLVKTIKPGLSVDALADAVKKESCKCVQEAGRLLAATNVKKVSNA